MTARVKIVGSGKCGIIRVCMLLYKELSYQVIGAAMEVHGALGSGFLESVYGHALAHELNDRKISFERQAPVTVFYKEREIGVYWADFLVDEKIVVEIKAASALTPEHNAQAIHYLAAMRLRLGLLINFGNKSLQYRRFIV